ncbi:MAG: DegV family protein [Candidatus Heimdallarchaeota archaeon]|nr:DegV family protein [Candidatus Heimdallarchaeota archaeon]
MSTKFSIVTDRASDIEPEFQQDEKIYIVPTVILFEKTNEVFRDTEITKSEFLAKLNNGEVAKTGQPSLEDFDTIYRKAAHASEQNQVLAIHVSSKLSGTFNSGNPRIKLMGQK